MKHYAGIGSRTTPQSVQPLIEYYAGLLAKNGYTLRSGGANGADSYFERACDAAGGSKEIYLPWPKFNGNSSRLYMLEDIHFELAKQFYWSPSAFDYLSSTVKRLMARNGCQVLGQLLSDPSDFIICWTKDGAEYKTGKTTGGTGQAIRVAVGNEIPVFNLKNSVSVMLLDDHLSRLGIV